MKKPKGSKPAKGAKTPKGGQPHHHPHRHHHPTHLSPHQQQAARRARIRSLQRQLHNARHPGPVKKSQPSKKPRGLALGEAWPCCSAEALGVSLRLAGWPVAEEDVLALHVAAGGSRDAGVSILAALEAASEYGLAGVRPRGFESCWDALQRSDEWIGQAVEVDGLDSLGKPLHPFGRDQHGLIVGAELPGPHALALDGAGVWTWGEWHPWPCFSGALIEEAYMIEWPR